MRRPYPLIQSISLNKMTIYLILSYSNHIQPITNIITPSLKGTGFMLFVDLGFIDMYPTSNQARGCLRAVMVKAMDCGIVVREFVLQLRYYVRFRTNTLGKGMTPLILPAIG